jgi:hypothetical protein
MATIDEQYTLVSQLGIYGAINQGAFQNTLDGKDAPPAFHIVHRGSMATFTPSESDNGAYTVFDYAGDMVITLPASLSAPELNPFTMFVVNTLGRIDFVCETPFIGYAPHVEQNVTCGLLRGMTNWYASGTNNKAELS